MTFKKLVEAIVNETPETEVCGMIAQAFQAKKITWKDYQTLYALINLVYRYYGG